MWRVAAVDLDSYIADAYRITAEKIAAGELHEEEDPATV